MKKSILNSIVAFTLTFQFLVDTAHAKPKAELNKVIDFEDEVVEGLNKRPLDSLSSLSEADRKKKKPHLYRKRAGFRHETLESLREARYQQ